MRLSVTIPALDEEESIRSIIERTLAAREHILESTGLSDVEIVVVSDGSTDRTAEIAREFADEIRLIEFEENQGYGAAITAGWGSSDAELLGFLDADGTCDPRFFADLVAALDDRQADIALGCRLHAGSHMPLIRRIGNHVFAWMLSAISLSIVRDVASGMRVVRRSALPTLYPLPSGLNFTPAMSTRAILSRELEITEIDMPYDERAGESKLNVLRDGWRFLRVILETTFLYRPNRLLAYLALAFFGLCALMMAYPGWTYLQGQELEEWMIYRFLVSVLLATAGVLMICVSHLARKAADISLARNPMKARYTSTFGKLVRHGWFWALPILLVALGVALVWNAGREYLRTGEVYEHWSRFVVMMFFLMLAALLAATKFLDHCLNLLAERLAYLRPSPPSRIPRKRLMKKRRALGMLASAHGELVHGRRVRRLAEAIAPWLEPDWHVLDVGCGDGSLGALLAAGRPDLRVEGVEIAPRPGTHIPVLTHDGASLPFADREIDAVLLIDVLHHTDDPRVLLREARRVARHAIVLKDHRTSRPLARLMLRFMDWVGNKPYDVALPYNYWSESQWSAAWKELGITVDQYRTRLDLYPGPARFVFESGLHFLAKLSPGGGEPSGSGEGMD